MATTTETPTPAAPPAPAPVAPARLRWVLPVSVLLVVAPFLVTALRVALRGTPLEFGGDQAIIGLDVHDAADGSTLRGPYSRYGWSHPGPSWFYLLSPFSRLAGGDDAALAAASLAVHGLLAAAVVIAVHQARRPLVTLAVAGLLLALVLRLPAFFFVDVWNPYALVLAATLLMLLAVRARNGSWTVLVALLVTGSHLVQTHVGTAPVVGLVGVVGLVAFVLGRRAACRPARDTPDGGVADAGWVPRRHRWQATAALAVVLVAMWVPPVAQQLTAPSGEGNLGRLLEFFTEGDPAAVHPTTGQAVTAVGRVLAMTPYGWDPGPFEMDVSTLPLAVAVGLVAQVLAGLALVAAGRWRRAPGATWTGVVVLVALAAAVFSARSVSGVLYWYLLTWVTVLPAVTLAGVVWLVADAGRGPALPARSRPLALVAAVAVAVGSVATTVSLDRATAALPDSPGVRAADGLLGPALAGLPVTDVHVDIATHALWPVAAGVVEDLAVDGWTVRVDPVDADLFGTARVGDGGESVGVVLVAATDPALPTLRGSDLDDLGTVETELGPMAVLLRTGR